MRRFSLEPGAPERLEIDWMGLYNDVVVRFDGREVARISKMVADQPYAVDLGGSELLLRRTRRELLEASIGGQPLPQSDSHPDVVRGRLARYGKVMLLGHPVISGLGWWFFHSLKPGVPASLPDWARLVAIAAVPIVALTLVGLARQSPILVRVAAGAVIVTAFAEQRIIGPEAGFAMHYLFFFRACELGGGLALAVDLAHRRRRSASHTEPVAVPGPPTRVD